ncbi:MULTISPECIES: hypothetical protein [unclassified Halorhabdus]|nr:MULTISPECIES: hypothetical protein [unclassified Halorhabdus]WEL16629.1 Uncharacterized protein SVXHr_0448 [Halorhabdus sp. SVX81]WEL20503.1 Uncharacterized protein HBNXHr_0428 [Halorhabdus sp. BNX81]
MPRSDADADREASTAVQSFQSSPDRTVFTEEGNPDGWIATDLTVDPTP